MSSIPIIYTGKESARFNWNALGQNMRDSYRRIKEDAVNQQRYNDIQAERQRQAILNELDADRLAFGNEQVQAIETKMYDDFMGKATTLVQEKMKTQGRLSTEDYLTIRTMSNKYERDMLSYKASEERRLQDLAVATDPKNIDKFDQNKIKQLAQWDYRNGMYPNNALDSALVVYTPQQMAEKDAKYATDPNMFATRTEVGKNKEGDEYKATVVSEYDKTFYQQQPDGTVALKAEPAVDYIKDIHRLGSNQQVFASKIKNFNNLDPIKRQSYMNKWGDEETAATAWYLLDKENEGVAEKAFPLISKVKTEPSASTSMGDGGSGEVLTVDVSSGVGSFGKPPLKLTGRIKGATDYDGKPVEILGGLNDVLITDVEYIDGKGWMAVGQISEKGGKGLSIEQTPEGGTKVTQGGEEKIKEFIIPLDNPKVQESIKANKYVIKGLDQYSPKKSSYTIKGKEYTEDELIKMGYTTEQIAPYKN